jgi:hypothetical protein
MPSEKLAALRARLAVSSLALGAPEVTQTRQDIQDLLTIVERAEDLLDALYHQEQTPKDFRGPTRDVGRDVWANEATTSTAAVDELRTRLADALGWEAPGE